MPDMPKTTNKLNKYTEGDTRLFRDLLAFFFVASPAIAQACSCMPGFLGDTVVKFRVLSDPVATEIREGRGAGFTGHKVRVETLASAPIEARLTYVRGYKARGGSCGFEFERGMVLSFAISKSRRTRKIDDSPVLTTCQLVEAH